MRREVDWDSVEREGVATGAHAGEEGWEGKQRRRKKDEKVFVVRKDGKKGEGEEGQEEEEESESEEEEEEGSAKTGDQESHPFLTVGLIGKYRSGFLPSQQVETSSVDCVQDNPTWANRVCSTPYSVAK